MGPDSGAAARAERTQRVLRALRLRGEATLAELTKIAKISRPTASAIIADLEEMGLVAQSATSTGAGRPAALYSFAPRHGVVLALDLQRDEMALTIASLSGAILYTALLPLARSEREERLDDVAHQVIAVLDELTPEHGDGICGFVSTTGIVDGDGVVLRSYLVPQWHGLALADELSKRLGFPVRVDNDINTAAYGEFMNRVESDGLQAQDTMLYIRLFAGFRTGLILRGEVHHGASWHAGEVNDTLNTDLRARLDEVEDPSGWALRAATTIGAISSVVDPHVVVLSTSPSLDERTAAAVQENLESMRLPTAPKQRIESAELAGAAASLGALSLALRDAEKSLLGAVTSQPIAPISIDEVVQMHRERGGRRGAEPRGLAVVVSEPLRVGIVGLGMRAQIARHVESDSNKAQLVAACDPDPAAASRVSSVLGKDAADFSIVGSVRELIEFGIGAAFVTSPDDTHANVAVELLDAGIPVYLEKPLATTLEDSTRVLMAAYRSGTQLYVGHNMRHMSFVRQMRELILDGAIGDVQSIWCRHFVGNGGDYYFKDWHADRRRSNGLLLQKAAHDIDVMHWLAGSETKDVVGMGDLMVYGKGDSRSGRSGSLMGDWFSLDNWPPDEQKGLNDIVDVEDVSMLMMRMRSGVLASYQQCHFTPDYWRNYTVIGTRGRLENFGDGEGGTIKLWNKRSFYNAEGDAQFPILGDRDGHSDADALTVAEFLRFVRHQEPTDTSPLGAWQAVATGIQATESLRDGSTPREIPQLPAELVSYFSNNQQS